MSVERLSFNSGNNYSAIELSIHLARYSTAQKICKGLNVLDVACGEGYGAFAMASFWEAKSVKGVDISEEAIQMAQNVFSHPNVEYIAAAAEKIDELFEENSFDMVISLETIEHVNSPEIFLSAIKKVLNPNGIIILSCPNDHWYYGPGESENPFHLRTYYFNEFKDLVEKQFGGANCYLLGRPITGFGNFLWSANGNIDPKTTMTEELLNSKTIQVNQVKPDEPVLTDDCSFFVGVWGDLPVEAAQLANAAFYSTSMDKFSLTLEDRNKALTSQVSALTANLENSGEFNKNLQFLQKNSQTRIADLEKWTVELQSVVSNYQNRILELDKLTSELQSRISELENQITSLQIDLIETSKKLDMSQLDSEKFQKELEDSKTTIKLMEESKFWKIRNQWFNLKDNFPSEKNKGNK